VTIALISFYPSLTIGLIFCAASIALSRIILGMHFLTDVVAGAAIGSILGFTAAHLLH
jgi:undecaprenyl-diphosphatase